MNTPVNTPDANSTNESIRVNFALPPILQGWKFHECIIWPQNSGGRFSLPACLRNENPPLVVWCTVYRLSGGSRVRLRELQTPHTLRVCAPRRHVPAIFFTGPYKKWMPTVSRCLWRPELRNPHYPIIKGDGRGHVEKGSVKSLRVCGVWGRRSFKLAIQAGHTHRVAPSLPKVTLCLC